MFAVLSRFWHRSSLVPAGSVLAALLLAGACAPDQIVPTGPSDPNFEISDGAHDGNDKFFFLPPMVPSPSPTGTFDGSLEPEVQICVWNGSDCDQMVTVFNINTGPGSEAVRVSSEHYIVNWHTENIIDNYPLDAGETFRIRVLVAGRELGFADIEVVGSAKDLKNVDTDEFIGLLDGRTLPIKFRIEEGALGTEVLSTGQTHTCVVATDGQAYCWGRNDNGALGNGVVGGPGPAGSFNTPQAVLGGLRFQSVQANTFYTCGLTIDGQTYCWGANNFGQLGIGASDFSDHPVPEPVVGGHTFVSISANLTLASHNCGVTALGDMYCWGLNNNGQVGTGTTTFVEPAPVLVAGGHTWSDAAPALGATCGLTTGGEALCWGRNRFGLLGNGTTDNGLYLTPAAVVGTHAFSSLTGGTFHVCGINTAGAAVCWGLNGRGQLGNGTIFGGGNGTPGVVIGLHSFTQLGLGTFGTCGVRPDGAGLCWGLNATGQLGRGFTTPAPGGEPTPDFVVGVPVGTTFQTIDPGAGWTCGTTTTGNTFCWGGNGFGFLGDGTNTNNLIPQLVIDLDPGA